MKVKEIAECRTLYELLDTWLLIYKLGLVKETTYRCYDYAIKKIKKCQQDVPLDLFGSVNFKSLLCQMMSDGLSKSTITKVHICIKSAFAIAVDSGTVAHNPAYKVAIPQNAPEKKIEALTVPQQKQVIDACHETMYGEYALFLICTGLRISEFINLRWDDYDQSNSCLKITQSKTEAGIRIIPLLRPAEIILTLQPRVSEYIFLQKNGNQLTKSVMRRLYERLRRLTGIQEITNHVYRHTYATRAVEQHIEYTALAKILGHTSPAFTMQRYVTPDLEHLKKEVRRLDTGRFVEL